MRPKIREEKIYEVQKFCNVQGTEWLKGMLLTEDEVKGNHIPMTSDFIKYIKTEKIIINRVRIK